MDYLNSIYYTFSTIAQVISGIIALSGVFVLFKIQELKKIQLLQVQHFYNYMSGYGLYENRFYNCPNVAVNLKILRDSESTGGLISEMQKILENENVKNLKTIKQLTDWFQIVNSIQQYKNLILRFTLTSMIIGILSICFSLIVLSRTHLICKNQVTPIFIIGLTLAIVTIILIGIVIILSLKDYKLFNPNTEKDGIK